MATAAAATRALLMPRLPAASVASGGSSALQRRLLFGGGGGGGGGAALGPVAQLTWRRGLATNTAANSGGGGGPCEEAWRVSSGSRHNHQQLHDRSNAHILHHHIHRRNQHHRRALATQSPAPVNHHHANKNNNSGGGGGGGDPLPVPAMGESISEGTIIGYMKAVGDTVAEDDIVAQIETDKIVVDVRAPRAGRVTAILAADGDVVKVGQPIAHIDYSALAPLAAAGADTQDDKPTLAEAAGSSSLSSSPTTTTQPAGQKQAPAPVDISPVRNMSESGERRVAMTRMRRRIAERLKEAQNTAAMLTTFNEMDMSALMDLRNEYKDAFEKKHGAKLGFMSAFVKASTVALLEQPEVNAFIDGPDIVYRDYVDISVAVSTAKGLVVPAIRGCENMNFAAIEKTIVALGERARKSELTIEEMQGGTFTISNGGVFGSLLSTPIINMPQSAILGMHIIQKRPVVVKDQIVIRPMMYVALSYDHRLIDGREAVTFLRRIKTLIEDPRRLLLEIDI